jgi:hypothetical protein
MSEEAGNRVPFEKRDPSDIANELADAFGTFAFFGPDDPPVSNETAWSDLSDQCRNVVSAEMLNEPQDCRITKSGAATVVLATCQVETGGGYGVFEECIAYQPYETAAWKAVWYRREETD